MIPNYAILNGALELLPDSLATMAIIPLQMKMVYRIGKSYGYELDRGHIKDFLATAGIGMASQYVEQVGIRLLGSLFGKKRLRGMIGRMANQAISSGFSFATTYALGRLAVRYYAGGRTFSTQVLKDTYAGPSDRRASLAVLCLGAFGRRNPAMLDAECRPRQGGPDESTRVPQVLWDMAGAGEAAAGGSNRPRAAEGAAPAEARRAGLVGRCADAETQAAGVRLRNRDRGREMPSRARPGRSSPSPRRRGSIW